MMNPAVYLREAERYERERSPHIHPKEICRNALPFRYTRQVLSSGCILIQMLRRGCPSRPLGESLGIGNDYQT